MFEVTCDVCGTYEKVGRFIFELSVYGHKCSEC
jgi:hypothetical protein